MNIVILGRPGAGKGTQSKLIEQRFGLVHLSTGDLLRSAQQQDNDLAREISQRIDHGNFVSDELIMSVVEDELSRQSCKGYIFDGIPRTERQLDLLRKLFARFGRDLDAVIELKVDEESAGRRLLDRGQKENRKDDNEATITHRFSVYEAETAPLIDRYGKLGTLTQIDGTGTPEEVFAAIEQSIGQVCGG